MDVLAVICIHGGGEYLETCLNHLIANGVGYAVIDNGIDAAGRAVLATAKVRRHLIHYTTLPHQGFFELRAQLEKKEEVIDAVKADWYIHLDVDEIMHSYRDSDTLEEALARVDAGGWTAVNFDEFVFLPVLTDYNAGAGARSMRHYYFFEPTKRRLIRARKRIAGLSAIPADGTPGSGGHALYGDALALAPETFALRHYIVGSQEHAFTKYTGRRYSEVETRWGWHSNRIGFDRLAYRLPQPDRLLDIGDPQSRLFDRSRPEQTHFWEWHRL